MSVWLVDILETEASSSKKTETKREATTDATPSSFPVNQKNYLNRE